MSLIASHPYYGRELIRKPEKEQRCLLSEINKNRESSRQNYVTVRYYYDVRAENGPLSGLCETAKMILEHGTVKPWHSEGGGAEKPMDFDENMSWLQDIALIDHDAEKKTERGILEICYPLHFFDKDAPNRFTLSRMLMAIASEPFSAFSFYRGAKIIDLTLCDDILRRMPGCQWGAERVRAYLNIPDDEPIIGTIVKPKAGLTPEQFAANVCEAACAGARFTKADENLHLNPEQLPVYVKTTVEALHSAGFDLGKGPCPVGAKRFLFAPHITAPQDEIMRYARTAVEAGANALMFSPYYGGGFELMGKLSRTFDVPVYAHTAGMNLIAGSETWGIDSSVFYRLANYYGAAFMQITAYDGYLKPGNQEKDEIMRRLAEERLLGPDAMTLVVAGGIGATNIGKNMRLLGMENKMFLAGSSVYGHPDGVTAGVQAVLLAFRAYAEKQLENREDLMAYARALGDEGQPLLHAL